jgi:putative nucleotidyltransferase with HDIG domain
MADEPNRKRKNIGVLIDLTVDPYQQTLLRGIMDAAKARGANCIVFEGGEIGSLYDHETQRNMIYRLASNQSVDGLVVLSTSIASIIGVQETKVFCDSFRSLPLVSISEEIPHATSVLSDNRTGMRALMNHLVERHGYRRFGCIKGGIGIPDADERFDVFLEVLRNHRLPFLSGYIFQGNFTLNSGIAAAKELMKKGVDGIDVVVAANDDMARGMMQELQRQGVRVPEQMAVTGFDDFESGDALFPLLTTVRQPIYEEGGTAAGLLIDILEGKEVPSKVVLPTRMVIRESCRCLSGRPPPRESADAGPDVLSVPAMGGRKDTLPYFRELMQSLLECRTDIDPETVARQLDQAWKKDPSGLAGAFHSALRQAMPIGADFFAYGKMIGKLWNSCLLPEPKSPVETAIYDQLLRAVVALSGEYFERESWKVTEFIKERAKLQLIRELLFNMDLDRQMDVLERRIPEIGIASCYVSLFQHAAENNNEQAECILAIRNQERTNLDPSARRFPSKRLVPDDFLSDHDQHMLIVEAMKEIGFIVFEMGDKPNRFFAYLSDIISGAVQGAVLYRTMEDQKNDLDRNLNNMRKVMAGFIQTMSATVETRDPYTAGHQRRVSDLARTIATEMGLTETQIECVRMAGIVHDLGKIYIPVEILNRAGELDDIEWSMIKRHPKVAWEILKNIDFPWPIADIVLQHHERMNGQGYPNGLKGEAISIEARILAVADVVEAMSSHRPYRDALGIEKALDEINKNKGILYDAKVVEVCTDLFRKKGYKFRTTDILSGLQRKS